LEDLIEACDFEDRPEIFLHGGERKFIAVLLSVLHSANKHRKTGTIKIRDLGKINDGSSGFMGNDLAQGSCDFGRDVEIYLRFNGQYLCRGIGAFKSREVGLSRFAACPIVRQGNTSHDRHMPLLLSPIELSSSEKLDLRNALIATANRDRLRKSVIASRADKSLMVTKFRSWAELVGPDRCG